MGSFRRPCQHCCLRSHPHAVSLGTHSKIISFDIKASSYLFSLTASKEAGVTIEIDGKKVALGVPGAQRPVSAVPDPETYPQIPLRRGGTPEDAAGSVLLYVITIIGTSYARIFYLRDSVLLAWPLLSLHTSLATHWKSLEVLGFNCYPFITWIRKVGLLYPYLSLVFTSYIFSWIWTALISLIIGRILGEPEMFERRMLQGDLRVATTCEIEIR